MNQADTPRPYGRHAGAGPGSGVSDADPLGLGLPAQTSLELVIGRHGPMTPAQAARIGLSVLDQLMSVHRHGMAHGDVRPGSVLMGPQDQVVLAGPSLRSPVFTAPEGVTGPVADLWSLGATLFTAVEGRPPAPGASLQNAGPLGPILVGLLAGDPALRPDPGALRDGLVEVSQGRPAPFPALPALPAPPPVGPGGAFASPSTSDPGGAFASPSTSDPGHALPASPFTSDPGGAFPLSSSDSAPGRTFPGPVPPLPQPPWAGAPLQAPSGSPSPDPGAAPGFSSQEPGPAPGFPSPEHGAAPPLPAGAAGAAPSGPPELTVPFRIQPSAAAAPGAAAHASASAAPSVPPAPTPASAPAPTVPATPADSATPAGLATPTGPATPAGPAAFAGPAVPAPADSAPSDPPPREDVSSVHRDVSSRGDSGPVAAVPPAARPAGRPDGVLVPRSIVALTGVLMAGMAVTIGILLVPVLSGSGEESTDPGAKGRFAAAPRACGLLTDAQAGEVVPGFRSSEVEPAECNWLNSADWRKPGSEKFDLRVRLVAQKQDGSEVRRAQEYLAGRKQDTRDRSERATPAPLPPQDLKGLGEEAFITGGYGPSKLYGGSYKVTVVFRVSNLVAEVEYERGSVKEDADGRVAENGAKVARWVAEALRARG
ncbi:protein kinase [Planomonospora sphaerica]|uniref:Protein kinase n=1 Tax=Planomonospora sphaerica TaxID=161355 RepID=A0A161LB87_9ACTN|nr:hypothetical protein [Planomonospora sphaerica]GAT65304.1 protein kinase [Planomonospora sphaerica]